ncbi:MAG: DNA polymerase III subunit gamma/tau [Pusillimonas sp.]|nr:DNA polymerase III subunit gamma/tau [Pusillimonas sp.]MBC43380.1 DNA polymerase III subunit gamma/tau [Pusillimonas sp.]HCP78063.1 DNA polymerase III subunit gamma/tau [Pusillimonas sp.]|tara:strand:- start:61150 stop:63147 length:1998 start_codon:yes stop_codon:yes gene_type:complete
MTYLVLARKWRPRSFDTLVGQDHVVRALSHALDTQRLHHAWLFTGTRGVGKTTLSRILAKSLNCEKGITSSPCGHCQACIEIDAGRFVDYVELDAASNRGVEEMTQLLEQAVYAPGAGRFKVYMIDEVHMLSGHAFNAMLKTLEEPPAHVKFILATTDPQKIPATVLSRCLQFNLKQMTAEGIVGHLQEILEQESIAFEVPALRLLAQAASGSMRDALSLTDQAIAYSAGRVTAEDVRGMLGTIDQRYLVRLLEGLAAGDGAAVVQIADELATRGLSYSGALADFSTMLSRVAIEQRVPGITPEDDPACSDIKALAGKLSPDVVQLFYTVAVHSRSELALSPDEYAGFVMACLRMLALLPGGAPVAPGPGGTKGSQPDSAPPAQVAQTEQSNATTPRPPVEANAEVAVQAQARPKAETQGEAAALDPSDVPAWEDEPGEMVPHEPESVSAPGSSDEVNERHGVDKASAVHDNAFDTVSEARMPVHDAAEIDNRFDGESAVIAPDDDFMLPLSDFDEPAAYLEPASQSRPVSPGLKKMTAKDWPALAAGLAATGVAAELARQSEWLGVDNNEIILRVAVRTLAESPGKARLCTLLSEHFGLVVTLRVEFGVTGSDTAHAVQQAEREQRQREAEASAQSDPLIRDLLREFDARILSGSIVPLNDKAA